PRRGARRGRHRGDRLGVLRDPAESALARRPASGDLVSAARAAVRGRYEDHRGARGRPSQPRGGVVLDPLPRNLRRRIPGTFHVGVRGPGDRMKKLAVPVFSVLAASGFVVSIYLIFMATGLEYGIDERTGRLAGSSLFFNQKIFYFHIAHALVLFTAVFVAGICSILFLWKRNPKFDDIASASTEVAVAFG